MFGVVHHVPKEMGHFGHMAFISFKENASEATGSEAWHSFYGVLKYHEYRWSLFL